MLFIYQATSPDGRVMDGTIDAPSEGAAIGALQRRGLIVVWVKEKREPWWQRSFALFDRVKLEDIVILSRQLATLFEAKVSVLDAFKLLAAESENPFMKKRLGVMIDDIESGVPISAAMSKHPEIFSQFYVSMIRSGEESGKMSESFTYLAEYLERSSELISKVKNALIYPIFVIASFSVVMVLMLVVVIPQLSVILTESGKQLPVFTRLVIGVSDLFVNYGVFMLILLVLAGMLFWRYRASESGRFAIDKTKLHIPYFGDLYRKLYLARFSDNMDTLLSSGISMVRAIEVTSDVVGNEVYRRIMIEAAESIRGGASFSESLARYDEIPQIIIQMSKIGEETGKLGYVLKTIARFYKREVNGAVDTIVGLIEPAMIVFLGLGVGILLLAVLGPIYNITGSI